MRLSILPATLCGILVAASLDLPTSAFAADPPSAPLKSERPPPSAAEVRILTSPLMLALDADKDGDLSPEELQNATAALKKLDQNNDGKVDRMELRPVPRNPDNTRASTRTNMAPAEIRRITSTKVIDQMMSFDTDKNGRLTKEELPERMRRVLDQADANKDQVLDAEELKAFSEQLGSGNATNPPARTSVPAQPKP